jgi:hypothetical protein
MKKQLFTALITLVSSAVFCQTQGNTSDKKSIDNILAVNTLSNSITISPKVITFPVLTTAAIDALPAPKEGMFVYDQTEGCLKQHNGTFWSCMGSRKPVFLLNGPVTLDESHSVIIWTGAVGSANGLITLPPASAFTGKEYRIVNQVTGTGIPCSLYRISQISTGNIIPGTTEVLLISDGTTWRQIN